MKIKEKLIKTLIFLILSGILFLYLKIENNKFNQNKIKATQKIVDNLSIRYENFFEDEKYVKEYKEEKSMNTEEQKKEEIAKKVKNIITSKRYVLQIATYSIKDNALQMQNRLKPIDNFLIQNSKINNNYYIVVSREFYSRNEAEALEMKVKEKFTDLKPLIKLRYSDGKSSKH